MTSPILKTWCVTYVETRVHKLDVTAATPEAAEAKADEQYFYGTGDWHIECIDWKHHETEEVQP